jgi:hypothetical protein
MACVDLFDGIGFTLIGGLSYSGEAAVVCV